MKKITLVAMSALIASSAFALDTKMDLKGRFDYLNSSTQTNGGTKVTAGNYSPNTLKLKSAAKFNETTSAELTLDFTQDHAAGATRSLSDMVDVAAVTKSLGRGFTAIVGKQPVLVGGRENDYASRDMYSKSLFSTALFYNQVGLTAQYDIADQSFYAQHLENAGTAGTTVQKDSKIAGLAYYGTFLNGMIAPILSYHKAATDRGNKSDIYTAAGVKFTHGLIIAEVDYLMLSKEQTAGTLDQRLSSVVAHLRYNHEMYKPFFKYIMETGKNAYDMGDSVGGAGVSKSERTAYELGLEVVPNKDEDMRYHVVYSSSEKKEKTGGTDKFKEDKIFAGLAFAFNILK